MSAPLPELRAAVQKAAAAVRGDGEPPPQTRVERPKRDDQGDYSTNVAMLLAPALGVPPGKSPNEWGRRWRSSWAICSRVMRWPGRGS